MFSTFTAYAWIMLGIVIVAYVVIRVITGNMMVWDKAVTQESANEFRRAIFSYKPLWFAYVAWFILGANTFIAIHRDGMLGYLPIIYVIAFQLWKMRTPRDYRGTFGKVLCGLLPFTLAFYCFTYPNSNLYVFSSLLLWLIASMCMQMFTLRAIDKHDFFSYMDVYADNEDYTGENVFGQPGSGLEESDLDAGNVSLGIKGEVKTGRILDSLACDHKDLFVFHSVAWLSNDTYDIDHVIYYKGSIIFLDSKFWGKGTHEIDEDGNVFKDGYDRDLKIHLPAAMEEYLDSIADSGSRVNHADIWVVVHGYNDGDVTIGDSHEDGDRMMLLAGKDLEHMVTDWMERMDAGNNAIMDKSILSMFHNHVKF